ncbi:MAG TPA: hypothetical protein VL096_07775 [Pirellulaceae bacterium]|nr:hypothetical protein [Pirellulaceae bacterium]
MIRFPFLTALILGVVCASVATAADWITAPGEFTNDPRTGERVNQYTPIGPVYSYNTRADYRTSGFRYTQDSLQFGRNSFDRLHLVEEWGQPVRPYGEWQYPYRPYSVPYQAWGPPFGGLGGGGWGGWGPYGNGYGGGYGGHGGPIPPNNWPPQGGGPGGGGWNPGPGGPGGPGVSPYSSGGNYPSNRGNWDRPPSSGIGGT